jgi:hypothetical protein
MFQEIITLDCQAGCPCLLCLTNVPMTEHCKRNLLTTSPGKCGCWQISKTTKIYIISYQTGSDKWHLPDKNPTKMTHSKVTSLNLKSRLNTGHSIDLCRIYWQLIGNKEVASILYKHRFHDVSSIHKLQISLWGHWLYNCMKYINVMCGKMQFLTLQKVIHVVTTRL